MKEYSFRLKLFKATQRCHIERYSQFWGIKKWNDDRYKLVDVVMEAQDRFEAQIELQKLCAHTRLYLPASYTED